MTLPRLSAMTEYWIENPPMHLSVSAIIKAFGGKKRSRPRPEPFSDHTDANYVESGPMPVDAKGNPTKVVPKSLAEAVRALGGNIYKVKGRRGVVN